MDYREEYEKWIANAKVAEIALRLRNIDEKKIEDTFFRDLEFGTGRLHVVIGAGLNRMNIYVVAWR